MALRLQPTRAGLEDPGAEYETPRTMKKRFLSEMESLLFDVLVCRGRRLEMCGNPRCDEERMKRRGVY